MQDNLKSFQRKMHHFYNRGWIFGGYFERNAFKFDHRLLFCSIWLKFQIDWYSSDCMDFERY